MSKTIVQRILEERKARQAAREPASEVSSEPGATLTPEIAFIEAFLTRFGTEYVPMVTRAVSQEVRAVLDPMCREIQSCIRESFHDSEFRLRRELSLHPGGPVAGDFEGAGGGDDGDDRPWENAPVGGLETDLAIPIDELKQQLENIMSDPFELESKDEPDGVREKLAFEEDTMMLEGPAPGKKRDEPPVNVEAEVEVAGEVDTGTVVVEDDLDNPGRAEDSAVVDELAVSPDSRGTAAETPGGDEEPGEEVELDEEPGEATVDEEEPEPTIAPEPPGAANADTVQVAEIETAPEAGGITLTDLEREEFLDFSDPPPLEPEETLASAGGEVVPPGDVPEGEIPGARETGSISSGMDLESLVDVLKERQEHIIDKLDQIEASMSRHFERLAERVEGGVVSPG